MVIEKHLNIAYVCCTKWRNQLAGKGDIDRVK
jgi:hypothetical protein